MCTVIFLTTEGTGAVGRIERHNVHTFCTLMLSGIYNDRGCRNEK